MSKELKRVPMDFDWPLNEPWEGYLNPHTQEQVDCPDCHYFGRSTGYSLAGNLLHSLWYRHLHDQVALTLRVHTAPGPLRDFATAILRSREGWYYQLDDLDVKALVDRDRLWDFTRRPLNQDQERHPNGWTKEPNGHTPTADEVNAWAAQGMGHDAINAGICISARCERYGYTDTCASCDGHGVVRDPELEARIEAWKPTEPPAGEGYQLWQDTSEDSPISPVFATLDELCAWAAENATTFTYERASAREWREMLERDFVHHQDGNHVFI